MRAFWNSEERERKYYISIVGFNTTNFSVCIIYKDGTGETEDYEEELKWMREILCPEMSENNEIS